MWQDRRLLDLFDIEHPIVQAPMAGAVTPELAAAVANAGGLGSLAFAMLDQAQARAEVGRMRSLTNKGFNVNFFCHQPPLADAAVEARWKKRLAAYYDELGVDPLAPFPSALRRPFDEAMCDLVIETRPRVVSFHFGLPEARLMHRVKATGATVVSSATTVREAIWLEGHGADVVIAQGCEAGGHRGMFLATDVSSQVGTMALVPQVVDAVKVPVIAAGGIADGRGVAAAFALGASAVQIGTAYLLTPEAKVSKLHREALASAHDDESALTNVFTGRPARGIVNRVVREVGPISGDAPPFPLASGAIAPLRAAAEAKGAGDFTSLWTGQAARLGRAIPAAELTRHIADDALTRIAKLRG